MRGELSEAALSRIAGSLPKPSCLKRIGRVLPEDLALHSDPDAGLDVALLCLRDATDYFQEARLALHECKACVEWYRVERDPPRQIEAIFTGRFYADDIALRLYSAAEHLANFLQCFLGISGEDLKPYLEGRTSKASIVGHYLMDKMPDHELSKAAKRFIERDECQFSLDYRNKWVHDQRPPVEGLGMVWKREKRWRKTEAGRILSFGMGDEPPLKLEFLVSQVEAALAAFAQLLDEVFEVFWETVKELVEIRETEKGFEVIHTF